MKAKKRQKMCCHCEGEVDLDVIVCPFCAADLREEKPEQKTSYSPTATLKNLSTQASLYPPHYAPKSLEEPEPVPIQTAVLEEPDETKQVWGPIVLMTLSAQLFLLGFLMLLFSHKGAFVLKWDARLWFLYIFSSIPLGIFGYKALNKL